MFSGLINQLQMSFLRLRNKKKINLVQLLLFQRV